MVKKSSSSNTYSFGKKNSLRKEGQTIIDATVWIQIPPKNSEVKSDDLAWRSWHSASSVQKNKRLIFCQLWHNIVSLCEILSKPVSSPSSSSLPRAVQRRERVADAKVPASNTTFIFENFAWAEKCFTKKSFVTFVKNSTPVADVPVINRTC